MSNSEHKVQESWRWMSGCRPRASACDATEVKSRRCCWKQNL